MILENIRNSIHESLGYDMYLRFSGKFGDISINQSEIRKASESSGKSVDEVVAQLEKVVSEKLGGVVQKTEYNSGFFNIYLENDYIQKDIEGMISDVNGYIKYDGADTKTVVFDYSSPNIAKPFSVGHLRSTIIGQVNLNCHKSIGYKTVGINHIGDWGTQFGKLIVAIKKWSSEEEIDKDPIKKLNELYVEFHKKQEDDPVLDDEARAWFKKLEDGDEEARRLWQKCIAWSFKEFDEIYAKLGVKIDHVKGESFYMDKLGAIIAELKDNKLLEKSDGAMIVNLGKMPPALIQKNDGATLYFTRDLAAFKYRIETYNPEKVIYHVGNDQSLHFMQLEAVAKKLGWLDKTSIVFAGHGLLSLPEGKMSTRQGRTVALRDLIDEAEKRSLKIINEKNPDLANKQEVAHKLGVSAIKYSDLSQNRKSDIIFSFDKAVVMEGDSGPYLLYTYARMNSLIDKFEKEYPQQKYSIVIDDDNKEISKLVMQVPTVLQVASANSTPNIVCEHAHKIANSFNSYYEKGKIVSDDEALSKKNIYTVYFTREMLGKLLDILSLDRLDSI